MKAKKRKNDATEEVDQQTIRLKEKGSIAPQRDMDRILRITPLPSFFRQPDSSIPLF